jgi:hypothetical protein
MDALLASLTMLRVCCVLGAQVGREEDEGDAERHGYGSQHQQDQKNLLVGALG